MILKTFLIYFPIFLLLVESNTINFYTFTLYPGTLLNLCILALFFCSYLGIFRVHNQDICE